MYLDVIENINEYVCPILTILFFFILFFDDESRRISLVLLVTSIIFFMTPDLDESLNDIDYYNAIQDAIYVVIGYCGAAMLALMFNKDKQSKKHASLFVCVIFLHVMLSLNINIGEFWWNYYSKSYYNEILILIAMLQMLVSKDGFIRVDNGVQTYHPRGWVFNSIHSEQSENSHQRQKEEIS